MENIVVIPFRGHKIVNRDNRPLHGFRRHLGCGAFAAKFTANVWKILQLHNYTWVLTRNVSLKR